MKLNLKREITLFLFVLLLVIVHTTNIFAQVTQEWVAKYNGPGNYNPTDVARASVIDGFGNVYVTGWSAGNETQDDFATIKYNSNGVMLWLKRYNGPGNLEDQAFSIAIDGLGNVYVTGESSSGMTSDFATVKYNSGGIEQWVKRYNRPGSTWNRPVSVAVDGLGNVYVTGRSYNNNTKDDYVTIKYNSSGDIQWTSFYNGLGNEADAPSSMAIDYSANVYVTGQTCVTVSTNYDFATIKYNSSGVEVWAKTYNGSANGLDGAAAIAVDNFGNVYVTGTSDPGSATIKYNSTGVQQWVALYSYGYLNSIVLDNSGNIFVAGDRRDNYMYTYADFATIKYNSSGVQQWIATFDGTYPRNEDGAASIVSDGFGNVYVTGMSRNYVQNGDGEINTVKYNPSGFEEWVAKYGGPSYSSDGATSIGLDDIGNIYITGSSYSEQTHYDYLTIKYSEGDHVQFVHSGLDEPIGDLSYATDTVKVNIWDLPPQFSIVDVNVIIDTVLHPNTGDLEFTLLHAGTTDTLIYQAGGSGDNFILTKLNDSASTPIANGSAPFTGSFRPHKPLSQFNNLDATGNWVLKVYDRTASNTGTLNAWTLQLKFASIIGIKPVSNEIPSECKLGQNYPNPFNPTTKIKFDISKSSHVKLAVYDMLGREVTILVNENLIPGVYEKEWGASGISTGVYFYKITTSEYTETKKMILFI